MAQGENIAKYLASIGFQIDKASVATVDRQFKSLETKIGKLRQELQTKLALKVNVGQINTQLRAVAGNLDRVHTRMNNGVQRIDNYNSAWQRLAATLQSVQQSIPGLPNVPNTSQNPGGRRQPIGSGGFLSFLGGLTGGPMGWAMALGLNPNFQVGHVVRQGITQARELQSTERAMQLAYGDESKGKREFGWVKNYSQVMGLDVTSTSEQYARMVGAAKGSKLEGDAVKNIFRNITQFSAAAHMTKTATEGTLYAVREMISKGQVYASELNRQLGTHMPVGAKTLMAQAASEKFGRHIDVKELSDMMKKGKIGSDILIPWSNLLLQMSQKGGALEAYKGSSQAKENRFKNSLKLIGLSLYESGIDKGLAQVLDKLAEFLELVEKVSPTLGKGFSVALSLAAKALSVILEPLAVFSNLFQVLPGWLNASVIGVTAFSIALNKGLFGKAWMWMTKNPLIVFFTGLLLLLEDISLWARDDKSQTLMGDFFGSFENLSRWLGDNFFSPWAQFFKDLKESTYLMDFLTGKQHRVQSEANAEYDPTITQRIVTDPKTGRPIIDPKTGKPKVGNFRLDTEWEELRMRFINNEKRMHLKHNTEWDAQKWKQVSQTNHISITIDATGIDGTAEALRQQIAAVVTSFPGGRVA